MLSAMSSVLIFYQLCTVKIWTHVKNVGGWLGRWCWVASRGIASDLVIVDHGDLYFMVQLEGYL